MAVYLPLCASTVFGLILVFAHNVTDLLIFS